MKRRTTLLILTALTSASFLFAADKPDLSGNWKVDMAKSDFGQMPAPSKLERMIDHKEPNFKLTSVQVSERGERKNEMKVTTDGKDGEAQVMGQPAKVNAKWEGKWLVITTLANFQGNEIKSVEKWTLSDDGKQLTTEATMAFPQGENKTKLVFTKGE